MIDAVYFNTDEYSNYERGCRKNDCLAISREKYSYLEQQKNILIFAKYQI